MGRLLSGSEILLECLRREKVEVMFGLPGGAVLPLYDALYDLIGFDKVAKMFERSAIEIAPLAFMRGRTLNHSFVILDEAQTVKNAQSRSAEAVRQIDARHRLCLTGTPLENHLGELWSQFDFLLPGFPGPSKQFTRHRPRHFREQSGDRPGGVRL